MLRGMTGHIQDGGSVVTAFIFGDNENGEPCSSKIPYTLIYQEGTQFGWSDPFPEDVGCGRDNHVYRIEACGDANSYSFASVTSKSTDRNGLSTLPDRTIPSGKSDAGFST